LLQMYKHVMERTTDGPSASQKEELRIKRETARVLVRLRSNSAVTF